MVAASLLLIMIIMSSIKFLIKGSKIFFELLQFRKARGESNPSDQSNRSFSSAEQKNGHFTIVTVIFVPS